MTVEGVHGMKKVENHWYILCNVYFRLFLFFATSSRTVVTDAIGPQTPDWENLA